MLTVKRIGLMGCGVVAYTGHGPAIEKTKELILTSAYDPNPEQLARFKERFPDVQTFSEEEAFFRSGLDAVAITSPAPCHLNNVRAAARHGLPVLCEKPLAMNDADIAEMIATMEAANLPLATAFCYRFSPVALRIRELIREGAIGEVRALRLTYIWDLHGKYEWTDDGQRIESSRRVGRMLEGGPMVDCGVHQIDLARWWTGSEVVRTQSSGAWIDGEYEAPDHLWLHMDHENGAHTAVEMSFSYCHTAKEPVNQFTYEIIGTGGVIRYNRDGWRFEVRNEEGTQILAGADEKNFTGMYQEWARSLHVAQPLLMPTGRDGLVVTRIARTATEEAIAAHRALITRSPKK